MLQGFSGRRLYLGSWAALMVAYGRKGLGLGF